MYTLKKYFRYLSLASEKYGMDDDYIWIYNHLEKLLVGIFFHQNLYS